MTQPYVLPPPTGSSANQPLIPCPCCEGRDFRKLFEKGGQSFVKCLDCGLMLINPRPPQEDLLDNYTPAYTQKFIRKTPSKRRRAKRIVSRLGRLYVPRGRWLDVGCSAGFIVEAAQNAGYEAHGVDVEQGGIEHARNTLGLARIAHGFLEEQRYPDGFFDVVSVYEVIEHVPDLNRFVAELKRILAPGGVLEIRTPDVGHWRIPFRLRDWRMIIPSQHLYYFTRQTLDRVLRKHGLRIVRRDLKLKPALRVFARHLDQA